jgi:hypothetical protein
MKTEWNEDKRDIIIFYCIMMFFVAAAFISLLVIDCEAQETVFSDSVTYKPAPSVEKEKVEEVKKERVRYYYLKEAYKLAVFGAGMYIFKDQLKDLSIKHDKLAHFVLGYVLAEKYGWKFALGVSLGIEASQIDVFGIKGRYKDTFLDMAAYSAGVSIAIKF